MRPYTVLFYILCPLRGIAAPIEASAQTTCPSKPCSGYNTILQYCYDLFDGPVYGGGEFAGYASIECVCSGEDPGEWLGLQWAWTCWNCGKNTAAGEALLKAWIETCTTYEKEDIQAAQECWNSGLEEGCWGT